MKYGPVLPRVFWLLLQTGHWARQAFIPVQTGGLMLLFSAAYSGLFGHHQPCMREPGLVSWPHSMGNVTNKQTP